MSEHTIAIPEDLFERLRQVAEEMAEPVDHVALAHLRTIRAPAPQLEPTLEQELRALRSLSDDALRTIAREALPDDVQELMQELMDRNTQGTISSEERNELARYVERGNRLTVRKATALGLLKERGYDPDQIFGHLYG